MLRLASRVHSRRMSQFARRRLNFSTTKIDPDKPFEEERLPWYNPDQFYPIRIGEILDASYKVLGKLGYGAYSTVWLCRNIRYYIISRTNYHSISSKRIRDTGFVAIKVCSTQAINRSARLHQELKFYEHVSSLGSQHPGQSFIRGLVRTFEITGPTGQHLCLVHPPMHMTMRELQYTNPSHRLNEVLLKWTLSNVLNALSFLHDEANVIHTGS